MAVQYLCKENTNLILSEKIIVFAIKKLSDLKTPFGNAFVENVFRSDAMLKLCIYWNIRNPDILEQSYDEFGIEIRKNKITNLATKLQQRLFKQQVTTDTVNVVIPILLTCAVNNDGNDEASLPKSMTL